MKTQAIKGRRGRLASLVLGILSVLLIFPISPPLHAAAPAGSISVTAYGAVGNGKKDSLKAFEKALSAAKKQGKSVYIPAGNFLLSERLSINGVKVKGAGADRSVLTSTNPESGSIDLKGKSAGLQDLTHVYRKTGKRDGSDSKNSVTVLGASDFSITNIRIIGAGTAGILVRDGANGVISGNLVKSTKADGIHITEGSRQITVENNIVKQTGDDAIAVVSYNKDPGTTSGITIRGNSVGYGSKARGISVVGGSDVTIEKNKISNTEMAGIYVAVESRWDTRSVNDIKVSRNTVVKSGTRPTDDHPNILVFADTGKIDEVRFSNNVISNSVNAGIGVWGDGDIGNIYFTSNQVSNSGEGAATFKKGNIHKEGNSGF
ncbi:right-handed parallel beta-helix repeat-containing protein [Saccharibacillus alkalitolerans]|uniref:Right-handed parallel beta-helix repeat-containing protein n=1 Tax=Saccharibacillus alkalitolerans TaxID=2705290 RepID=A0ABX0FDU4_9BACL|nr:right-handed parallel beta-helix repeat-containing protein [Saccharibacillus alkalitolerans]NGZ78108.1 right-handed parallel beta-helix repeat-containing protein [Saccharibacillus alkalitolerans]